MHSNSELSGYGVFYYQIISMKTRKRPEGALRGAGLRPTPTTISIHLTPEHGLMNFGNAEVWEGMAMIPKPHWNLQFRGKGLLPCPPDHDDIKIAAEFRNS